jgi:hypothetical protein
MVFYYGGFPCPLVQLCLAWHQPFARKSKVLLDKGIFLYTT